jgi:hypothetical protein
MNWSYRRGCGTYRQQQRSGEIMDQFLKALQTRRATIQRRIEQELASPEPDRLRLSALKRLRVRFRDQIEFIERLNRNGDLARVQVVRRRSLQP